MLKEDYSNAYNLPEELLKDDDVGKLLFELFFKDTSELRSVWGLPKVLITQEFFEELFMFADSFGYEHGSFNLNTIVEDLHYNALSVNTEYLSSKEFLMKVIKSNPQNILHIPKTFRIPKAAYEAALDSCCEQDIVNIIKLIPEHLFCLKLAIKAFERNVHTLNLMPTMLSKEVTAAIGEENTARQFLTRHFKSQSIDIIDMVDNTDGLNDDKTWALTLRTDVLSNLSLTEEFNQAFNLNIDVLNNTLRSLGFTKDEDESKNKYVVTPYSSDEEIKRFFF